MMNLIPFHPCCLFQYLVDGDVLSLARELHRNGSDQRGALILTENHRLTPDVLADTIFASVVTNYNIGGPSYVVTQALRAINRNKGFLDPEIETALLQTV